jgi:hypothetical protein
MSFAAGNHSEGAILYSPFRRSSIGTHPLIEVLAIKRINASDGASVGLSAGVMILGCGSHISDDSGVFLLSV